MRDLGALIGADACCLLTRSESDGAFRCHESWGAPPRAWQKVVVAEPPSDMRELPVSYGFPVGPSLSQPVADGEECVLGHVYAARREGAPPFAAAQKLAVEAYARFLATEIRSGRLRSRLDAFAALADEAAQAEDPDQFLNTIATQTVTALGFSRCAIFLGERDDRGCTLVPAVIRGYRAASFPKYGLRCSEQSALGKVLKEGRVVIGGPQDGKGRRGFRRMIGTAAFVAAPIGLGREPVGVLLADNGKRPGAALPERAELLAAFARYAGTVLERIRSHAALRAKSLALAKESAFRENLLVSLGAGVMSTSAEGLVTAWNPKMAEIFRLPHGDAVGTPIQRLLYLAFDDDSSDALLAAFESALETGVPMHLWQQKMSRTDEVSLHLNVVIAPLGRGKDEQSGLAVVMEDVSDRVALETDMERMRHMAQIGQLTAQIAHELRNPLTSIRGAAQILEHMQPDGPTAEFARIICQEVNTLNQIADEFLEFARPTRMHWEGVDINHLLRQLAELWRPHCKERRVRLVMRPGRDLPMLWVDTARLKQILRNLILNAVQAMPHGGTLTLATRAYNDLNEAVVTVRDTGVGMTEEQQAHAFEPFYTTRTKGTGLGLSIVEKLVKAHGGRISMRSTPGKGTVVDVWLRTEEPVQ
jgi:signal transduction histidine kinase